VLLGVLVSLGCWGRVGSLRTLGGGFDDGENKLVLGVLCDKLLEGFNRAVTLIVDELASTSWLELDGWETIDAEGSGWGDIVLGSVHLGNDNLVLDRGVPFTERLIGGSESLAVSAPWSVKLDENVLGVVEDEFVELGGDNGQNGGILDRDWLAAEGRFHLAIEEIFDEWSDELWGGGDSLREWILELLFDILNDKGGPVELLEVHGLCVLGEAVGINPSKVELALVFTGKRLERFNDLFFALKDGVDEDIGQRKTRFSVRLVVIAGNFVHDWNSVTL